MEANSNNESGNILIGKSFPKKATAFTQSVRKTENIKGNLVQGATNEVQAEPVPFKESVFFFVYVIAFFIVVTMQAPISSIFTITNQINKGIFNWLRLADGYYPADSTGLMFDQVSNLDEAINFIDQIVQDDIVIANTSLFYDGQEVDDFNFLRPITSWRMVQTRVAQVPAKNNLTQYRWDPSLKQSTNAYGTNNIFQYSQAEGGFPVYVDMAYDETYIDAGSRFLELVNYGYFDTFSQSLKVDIGYYSGPYKYICYCGAIFTLSPTGAASGLAKTGCTKSELYIDSNDYLRAAFEGLFVLITIYYVILESKKVIFAVKTEKQKLEAKRKKPKRSAGQRASVKDQALDTFNKGSDTINGTINGLLKHIKDLWNFIDFTSIILCITAIICWIKYAFNSELNTTINSLTIQNEKYVIASPDQLDVMHSLNRLLEYRIDSLETYYRICALNGVLILVKIIKYLATISPGTRQILTLMIRLMNKVLPFLVLLVTLMGAFAICIFYFYGSSIEFFSSFGNAFYYTFANVMKNFNQLEAMLDINYAFTFILFNIYCFVILFIMVNMFLIYVVIEYRKYEEEQAILKKGTKQKHDSNSHIHPLSTIIISLKEKVLMRFLKWTRKDEYEKRRKHEHHIQKDIQREGATMEASSYDMNIQDTILQSGSKSEGYLTDVLKERRHLKKVRNSVKLFWTTKGMIVLLILLLILTLQRHIINDVYYMSQNLSDQFFSVQVSPEYPNKYTPDLDHLIGLADLENFLTIDMTRTSAYKFLVLTAASNQAGIPLEGMVIGDYNMIPAPQIVFTIRRKKVTNNTDPTLNQFLNITMSTLFSAGASVDESTEMTQMVTSLDGTRTYTYNYDAPGYEVIVNMSNYSNETQDLITDGMIDSSLNSLTMEIPAYQIVQKLPIYGKMTFYLDSAGSVTSILEFQAIKTLSISTPPTSQEVFFYVLDLIFGIAFLWYGYYMVKNIVRKFEIYNHWHQLYVADFPEFIHRKRFLRRPEFLRKLEYVFDAGEIINIFCVLLLVTGTIMDGVFFIVTLKLRVMYANVVLALRADTPNTLSYTIMQLLVQVRAAVKVSWWLRLLNSLTILAVCLKIIFYFSFYPHFLIITDTLKKSIRMSAYLAFCLLLVIFAFAYLVMFIIGTNDIGYADIVSSWRNLFNLLFGLSNLDNRLISTYRDAFIVIFFFYPFVVINRFILSNLFIGTIYNSYSEAKKEALSRPKEPSTLAEWVKITVELISRKKSAESKVVIDLTNEYMDSVHPDKVMDRFKETLRQAENIKDTHTWSLLCSRDLLLEKEIRKKLCTKAKELSAGHLQGSSIENDYDIISALSPDQRLVEFQVRELYWRYFKIATLKLSNYHDIITRKYDKTEEMMSSPEGEKKKEAVEKMKLYIHKLEHKIEENFQDIDRIQHVFMVHNIPLDAEGVAHEDHQDPQEEQRDITKKGGMFSSRDPTRKNFLKELEITTKK